MELKLLELLHSFSELFNLSQEVLCATFVTPKKGAAVQTLCKEPGNLLARVGMITALYIGLCSPITQQRRLPEDVKENAPRPLARGLWEKRLTAKCAVAVTSVTTS